MTRYESATDEIAGRLQGTDASLTGSIAEILAAALQELIEPRRRIDKALWAVIMTAYITGTDRVSRS